MRASWRYELCVALVAGLALPMASALAEEKARPGPVSPTTKGAPPPKATKWYVPELDSTGSNMRRKNSKTSPVPRSGKP